MTIEYLVQPAAHEEPVRFLCGPGEAVAVAGDVARECAADLAESLGTYVAVWLVHDGRSTLVDNRLPGNPSHWPYRHER
jgi:hypothetical protein